MNRNMNFKHGGVIMKKNKVKVLTIMTLSLFCLMFTGCKNLNAKLFENNGRFVRTGDMTIARMHHAATLLQDGRVLITGGESTDVEPYNIGFDRLSSAEIYNPKTGKFTKIADMTSTRSRHTSTLLQDGRVLITGGLGTDYWLASAEIFDPKTNTFTKTGDVNICRSGPASILLNNGKVLIVGGGLNLKPPIPPNIEHSLGNPEVAKYMHYGELYDPVTGKFMLTPEHKGWYAWPTLASLPDGRVLVTGGEHVVGKHYDDLFKKNIDTYAPIAEIYDPIKNEFAQIDYEPVSTKKNNGKILFLYIGKGTYPILYDINTGKFIQSKNKLNGVCRDEDCTTTLLNNNKVLIVGAVDYKENNYNSEVFNALYNLKKDNFTKLKHYHQNHTATKLKNGDVLITGGLGSDKQNKSMAKIFKNAELYKY